MDDGGISAGSGPQTFQNQNDKACCFEGPYLNFLDLENLIINSSQDWEERKLG